MEQNPRLKLIAERVLAGKKLSEALADVPPGSVLDFKFVALGHNTIRGAAGAAVLNAELMMTEGLLD